uniref:Uncharacterized protein n=1 Tax=Anguilla anguilla TaxID=7936 RepID=A0A0E9V1A4_ANGAN
MSFWISVGVRAVVRLRRLK